MEFEVLYFMGNKITFFCHLLLRNVSQIPFQVENELLEENWRYVINAGCENTGKRVDSTHIAIMAAARGPVYQHGLNSIPALIYDYIH